MDLNEDDIAAIEKAATAAKCIADFDHAALAAYVVAVNPTVLLGLVANVRESRQKLSDAREALRRLHVAVLDEIVGMEEQAAVDDSEGSATNRCAAVALRDAAKFMRQEVDRALVSTPAPIAAPSPLLREMAKAPTEIVAWSPEMKAMHEVRQKADAYYRGQPANGVTNFTDTQKAERQALLAAVKPTPVGDITVRVAVPATKRKFTGGGTRNCVPTPVAVPATPTRNMEDPESREFWEKTEARAEAFNRRAPHWLKGEVAPDPVQSAYAECARIARLNDDLETALCIEAAALRAGAKLTAAPDLALLAKFANGEGGTRTGVLMRLGLIRVEVTEAGRAALGLPSDDAHRPGALYAAVFPAVPAILGLFIESACPLDAEMARGVLAAVEACK